MQSFNSVGADPVLSAHPAQGDNIQTPERTAQLRKAANDLEAAFMAEMLKSAGFGKARDSYGGGAGEDQFGSLLVRAQAKQMTLAGGIGLAESLFNALMEADNVTSKRTISD